MHHNVSTPSGNTTTNFPYGFPPQGQQQPGGQTPTQPNIGPLYINQLTANLNFVPHSEASSVPGQPGQPPQQQQQQPQAQHTSPMTQVPGTTMPPQMYHMYQNPGMPFLIMPGMVPSSQHGALPHAPQFVPIQPHQGHPPAHFQQPQMTPVSHPQHGHIQHPPHVQPHHPQQQVPPQHVVTTMHQQEMYQAPLPPQAQPINLEKPQPQLQNQQQQPAENQSMVPLQQEPEPTVASPQPQRPGSGDEFIQI